MTQPSVMQVTGDDSGALYTIKLNEILSANTTLFAGASAPANPVAHMIWQDTSVDPPREYRRNATNSGWVDLGRRGAATFYGNITGSSATTDKLTTARAISISGAGTGSASFDGSANANITLTLANSGVTANTYGSASKIPVITVNAKGLITGVTLVDNPTAAGYVSSWNGRQGAVTLNTSDVFNVLPIASGNAYKYLRLNSAGTGLEWRYTVENDRVSSFVGSGAYTIQSSDREMVKVFTNTQNSSLTIQIPAGLPVGFQFRVVAKQLAAGGVLILPVGGAGWFSGWPDALVVTDSPGRTGTLHIMSVAPDQYEVLSATIMSSSAPTTPSDPGESGGDGD